MRAALVAPPARERAGRTKLTGAAAAEQSGSGAHSPQRPPVVEFETQTCSTKLATCTHTHQRPGVRSDTHMRIERSARPPAVVPLAKTGLRASGLVPVGTWHTRVGLVRQWLAAAAAALGPTTGANARDCLPPACPPPFGRPFCVALARPPPTRAGARHASAAGLALSRRSDSQPAGGRKRSGRNSGNEIGGPARKGRSRAHTGLGRVAHTSQLERENSAASLPAAPGQAGRAKPAGSVERARPHQRLHSGRASEFGLSSAPCQLHGPREQPAVECWSATGSCAFWSRRCAAKCAH